VKTSEFITYLYGLGIKLSYEKDRLRINAPKGAITPELRVELANRKADILALLQMVNSSNRAGALPLRPVSRAKDLPLSLSQQRLWFLDQFEPGNVAYNIQESRRIKGMLNITVLKQSLTEIVRRHEALRTTFTVVEEHPVQRISSPEAFPLSEVDLRHLPDLVREAEAQRLRTAEAVCPFDLAKGPLFRATLLQYSKEEYSLLFTMHHIISDGWSLEVLGRELWALYEAFSKGCLSPLPELPIQYADYAQWQWEWFQGEVLEKQLDYWKVQLRGAPQVLELPTDRPRPAVQSFRGAYHTVLLPVRLLDDLKVLSRKAGCSLFMTLLAAFQLILYRYTGQKDILVGSPIAGRNRTEIENLIGFFVNTLVLRTDFSGNPTFKELLGRVREFVFGAFEHPDLPFEKLVEELNPERQLSHNPLIQVMFGLQNVPETGIQVSELTIVPESVHINNSEFDLTLYANEKTDGLSLLMVYSSDLFEQATIERMLDHFRTVLEGIVTDPAQPINELPILTKAEQHRLLETWNDTEGEYPKDVCIHELLEDQAARTPENVAVVYEAHQLTYQELNAKANQVARYLLKTGVGPDMPVGICMNRSLDMLVGLLGILKAGGTYLPLDPEFPEERLRFMLSDSKTTVLLTQQGLSGLLPSEGLQVVFLDSDWEMIAQGSQENLASVLTTDNLAYIIYTSGSTGKPKGVQIPHRAVVNLLYSMAKEPGLTGRDILLAVTTLSFDIAVLELFLPIIVGARVVVASRQVATDAIQLARLMASSGTTVMQATPTTWRLLLESGWSGHDGLKILCGGETLPKGLAQQLIERCTSLWNIYGPTETTVWSAVHQVETVERPIPIGCPIANTRIYILDDNLQPVPVGVTGELYIGGDGLARGYLNRPELTTEKFIHNPFTEDTAGRLYKSGDLARYRPDGRIECLGRRDHQVKIRGYRIEPGEIEGVLSQHPAIQKNVVIVREDVPGDKRLVAYLVFNQTPSPTNNELRSFLKQKMPDYMVPSAFVFLDTLPLTPNNKVDHSALPAPILGADRTKESYEAPKTPVEIKIAEIWSEVLNVKKIGLQDNFFELGGHSLLATQVVSKIRSQYQVDISLRDFFESPTVGKMALRIIQDQVERTLSDENSSMFDELDDMSDEDATKLLEAKIKGADPT
jgi:amino acid adenylation domain-containing protein